jgi:hypothetical protein
MASKRHRMLRLYRFYKEETGKKEVDMREVAKFALAKGWPLPKPVDPIDRLARAFADVAKEEIRYDEKTHKPYRANHVVWLKRMSQPPLPLYIDIDEDHPRRVILQSLMKRREYTVSDMVQLTFDADHWNGMHPDEKPIEIPADLTDDVAWRKNSPEQEGLAG